MGLLLAIFFVFLVSMVVLAGIQILRDGELPTGCTPEGCRRCRKVCPSKAALEAEAKEGRA